MDNEITQEVLKAGPFENEGQTVFGENIIEIMRHISFRRLITLDRSLKSDHTGYDERSIQREWLVDGQPAKDLDDAIERLSKPSQLSDDEVYILEKLPRDWIRLAEFKAAFPMILQTTIGPVLVKLHLKGLIENRMETIAQRSIPSIRRTPLTDDA
ncbi:hypothetical protein [Methylobacterium sp. J-077]|uniref:hypothetical protein n=1 Tax=Methylobacterium sp. J-077 TaxID=2836656 RepID=UPI001FBB82C9|nr:hypothetical protein [Methylobacterium sp. J-077]MCJ2122086.1 hypothetical protein [Methylobacterium sp. J-077]